MRNQVTSDDDCDSCDKSFGTDNSLEDDNKKLVKFLPSKNRILIVVQRSASELCMLDVEKACHQGEPHKFLLTIPKEKHHCKIKFIHLLEEGNRLLIAKLNESSECMDMDKVETEE